MADEIVQAKNFPYVSSLPISQWGKIPINFIPRDFGTWDPFDPKNVDRIDKAFADDLPQHADDPLLIGYFLTNEPLYEDIPKVVPTLKGSQHPCKLELVRELSDKYQTIDAFNQAWGMSAASFDDLKEQPLNVKTKEAFADVNDFYGKFLETYYKLVSDTFHKIRHPPHAHWGPLPVGDDQQPTTLHDCRQVPRHHVVQLLHLCPRQGFSEAHL